MKLSIIVAISKDGVIGKGGVIPWFIPRDLQHFKEVTLNHPIIMGRATFESIGRLLPNRYSIIISSKSKFYRVSDNQPIQLNDDNNTTLPPFKIVNSIESALTFVRDELKVDQAYVIGGKRIYEAFQPIADELIITHVNTYVLPQQQQQQRQDDSNNQDITFYNPFENEKERDKWTITKQSQFEKDENNSLDFNIVYYNK